MRLAPERYLELLRSDGESLSQAAQRGLDRPVPWSPGWDAAQVLRHTGSVYLHKVACVRLGRAPREGEWQKDPPPGEDLVLWFRAAHAAIVDELTGHSADDPAYTWWPPEQTVGFWQRRMALETVVHRVDAESATNSTGPIDAALAADGVDEILTIMLPDEDESSDDGRRGTVLVHAAGDAWMVRLDTGATRVERAHEDASGDVEIGGDTAAVFLYLWGRAPADSVERTGDVSLTDALRRRLELATQ